MEQIKFLWLGIGLLIIIKIKLEFFLFNCNTYLETLMIFKLDINDWRSNLTDNRLA